MDPYRDRLKVTNREYSLNVLESKAKSLGLTVSNPNEENYRTAILAWMEEYNYGKAPRVSNSPSVSQSPRANNSSASVSQSPRANNSSASVSQSHKVSESPQVSESPRAEKLITKNLESASKNIEIISVGNIPVAFLVEDFFDDDPDRLIYDLLLKEIKPFLVQGVVKVFGEHEERRLTTFFSKNNLQMKYSGRILDAREPVHGGIINSLFELVNSYDFKKKFSKVIPNYTINLPDFNAVFINWYRPPNITEKIDSLGWHSDDTKSLDSEIILSISICEKDGERFFSLRLKKEKSGVLWEKELKHLSMFFMLDKCQDLLKHSVSSKKKNSANKYITGGRINLTFRSLKT